jgi:diguanylate cyclase (GGDEF)-like protein
VSKPEDRRYSEQTIVTERKLPVTDEASERRAYLVVIVGDDLGKRIELDTGSVKAGRSTDCEIPIDQESVSRHHARIWWTGAGYRVKDLDSTNGTFVNESAVSEQDLTDGDLLKVGRTTLKFIAGSKAEASYHEEIYRMKTFDGLTQIHNKRYFHEALEREISRSRRYARELALVLFDIDHFKKINDTFGHLAGDSILKELASVVHWKVRREDVFARVGGEEFAILTPEVGLEGACEVADKVRLVTEATPFRFEKQVIKATVSLGVAVWRGGDDAADALYQRADTALYAAKEGGRNRRVVQS